MLLPRNLRHDLSQRYISMTVGKMSRMNKKQCAISYINESNSKRDTMFGIAHLMTTLKRSLQSLQPMIYSQRLLRRFHIDDLNIVVQEKLSLFNSFMVSRRRVVISIPFTRRSHVVVINLSDLAGHCSFLFLSLSYLESDFMNLRLYALSGITLSIIFQYYREKPLWIPIRWNTLFLTINCMMILYLLKDFNDADNITDEQKEIYNMFQRKGMNKVDFLHLMNLATRVEAKKGQVLISDKKKNTRVYFIKEGQLVVRLNGTDVRNLHCNQFAGLMTFITWMEGQELVDMHKSSVEKQWERIQHDLFAETMPFIAFVMDSVHLHRDHRHDSGPHEDNHGEYHGEEHRGGKSDRSDDNHHHQQHVSISGDHDGTVTTTITSEKTPIIDSSVRYDDQGWDYSWYWFLNPLDDVTSFLYSLLLLSSSSSSSQPPSEATLSASKKTDPSIIDQHQHHGSSDSTIVHKGYADVICVQDSILYYWSFDSIHDLIIKYPSLGLAFERYVSDDLNRKMTDNYKEEPKLRYESILHGALLNNEITDDAKQVLSRFRADNQITDSDHHDILRSHEWTGEDYRNGYRSSNLSEKEKLYHDMLAVELSPLVGSRLSMDAKIRLLQFRVGNNISNNLHINFLKKLDWTLLEYELIIRNYHTDEQLGSKRTVVSSATPAAGVTGTTSLNISGKIHSIIRSFFF